MLNDSEIELQEPIIYPRVKIVVKKISEKSQVKKDQLILMAC